MDKLVALMQMDYIPISCPEEAEEAFLEIEFPFILGRLYVSGDLGSITQINVSSEKDAMELMCSVWEDYEGVYFGIKHNFNPPQSEEEESDLK